MNAAVRIVVVEDEADLCEDIVFNLVDSGFEVRGVGDAIGLDRELQRARPDVVVLDVGLPGEDGYAIARRLRSGPLTRSIGIVILTAMGELEHKVKGLHDGADAYLVKPVDFVELAACIQSLTRRLALAAASHWRYRPEQEELVAPSGERIKLTRTERKLVEILVRVAGSPVARRDIILGLGESPAKYDERRLETAVSRLRRKIEQSCSCAQPIQAVHGIGYAFTAPVAQESGAAGD